MKSPFSSGHIFEKAVVCQTSLFHLPIYHGPVEVTHSPTGKYNYIAGEARTGAKVQRKVSKYSRSYSQGGTHDKELLIVYSSKINIISKTVCVFFTLTDRGSTIPSMYVWPSHISRAWINRVRLPILLVVR